MGLVLLSPRKQRTWKALGEKKKNYIGDLEHKSRLRSQLGVASCRDRSQAGRILHFQMGDEDVSDKQF